MSRRLLLLGTMCFGAWGCGISKGWSNLSDYITKPSFYGFQADAQLVALGDYDHLKFIDWESLGNKIIVARHRNASMTTIAIRSLDGSTNCDVPGTDFSVQGPSYYSQGNDIDQSGEIIVMDNVNTAGLGKLTFYDRACAQLADSLENAAFPVATYGHDRFLVEAGSRLLIAEPRLARTEVLAENLEGLDRRSSLTLDGIVEQSAPLWFIDGGQFVALDDSGSVAFRTGKQVTEVSRTDATDELQVWLNDGGQLFWASATQTTGYATDVCGLHPLESGYYVEYHSPCLGGALQVARSDGNDFKSVQIDSAADHVVAFDGNFTNSTAIFTRPSGDSATSKELWFRSIGGTPQQLAERVAWVNENYSIEYPFVGTAPSGNLTCQLAAIVDSDGGKGRLVACNRNWNMNVTDGGIDDPNDRLLVQAEGVPVTSPITNPYYYQLASFDGSAGAFVDPFPSGPAIAQGVPADLGAYNTRDRDHMALLADYQSGSGRLGVMPANPSSVNYADTSRTISWIANNVPLASFDFYHRMPALGYIDQWDVSRGVGRLVVHDFNMNTEYYIADGVREHIGIYWPWVGIIFAVADGERQGIWAVRARQ